MATRKKRFPALEAARAAKAAKRAAAQRASVKFPFHLDLSSETARELYVRLKMDEYTLTPNLRVLCDTLAAQSFGLPNGKTVAVPA